MKKFNFHTHTTFSDGKKVPEHYVEEAIKQGMSGLGFSDHAPILMDTKWTMPIEKLPDYVAEINRLKEVYASEIEIYLGLEVDYIPGLISLETDYIKSQSLDYQIGAVHYVDFFADGTPWAIDAGANVFGAGLNQIFNNSLELALRRYFELVREMVIQTRPTIVAHLDRFKKNKLDLLINVESYDWYREEVQQTLKIIAEVGAILEVNTKGIYKKTLTQPYPSDWIIAAANQLDVPVHLAADAHHPELITAGFEEAFGIIQQAGYQKLRVLEKGEWRDVAIATPVHQ